jgi:hypothetical protein
MFFSWLRNWKALSTCGRRPHRERTTFRPAVETLEARDVPSFARPISITNSLFKYDPPVAQAVGDLNGDGKLDLVTITNTYGRSGGITGVEVMFGMGNGKFTSPGPSLNSGYDHPTALALADVNGDGKLDIITGNDPGDGRAYSMPATIGVLLGNGTGSFAAVQTYDLKMSFGPTSLAVGDFDGNGRLDIAVGYWDNEVDVAFNIEDNYWVNQAYALPSPTISGGSATIAAGDFNGDGKLDLVATNYSGAAYVLLNSGNGFASPQPYTAAGTAVSVAVGDDNGDGKLDLVVANSMSNSISVLPGNGDGTFATPQTYGLGTSVGSLALGDFNNDGKLDIVTTGGALDVLLNNGDGTFGTAQNVGPAGKQVMVADINGDGFPDLVQIDGSGSSIDILFNNGQPPVSSKGHK